MEHMGHKKCNLHFLRKQKGLTQRQLAKHLGFHSADRISKWEHGRMFPHVLTANKIAKILGVHTEELYLDS